MNSKIWNKMEYIPRLVCLALSLVAFSQAQASTILFGTGTKIGTSTNAAFSGSIELVGASATGGTLNISLTNESAVANGGYLTAVAFNNPGPVIKPPITLTSNSSTFDNLLGGSIYIDEIPAKPLDNFDIGAAATNTWLGGGKPTGGVAVGETVNLSFALSGDLSSLTTQSFIDTLTTSNSGHSEWMVVRFRGFNDEGSAKYGTSVVPIPGAAWLFGSALIGLAGITRRKKA